jgi:hypothetical protein
MRIRSVAALLVALIALSRTTAAFEAFQNFPPRAYENFDAYPDGYDLSVDYPLVNFNFNLNPSFPPPQAAVVTSSNERYPGIQGKAAEFDVTLSAGAVHSRHDDELMILSPEIFGPLVFRADVYDDGIVEGKRFAFSIRHFQQGVGTQNIIQMGFPFPGGPYSHFVGASFGLPASGWQPYGLPEEMNDRLEIGAGWHRFSAVITMQELIFQLDLHRDGVLDAVDVYPIILNPLGFNELRFGIMSPIAFEQGTIAIDNLIFAPIPESTTVSLAVIGGCGLIAAARRRREGIEAPHG